jgi:type II secretory pathway pseudopilin PulG
MSRTQPTQPGANGFAYLSLLIFLALMGFFCAMAVQVGTLVHRRAAEQALLDVGLEFARALSSYSDQTPAGMDDQPLSLQDLLLDKRQTERLRHLRKIYPDPMTGSTEWGLELDPDTRRIIGVFSLSTQPPIKVGNFPPGLASLNDKKIISEWVFSADTWANKELGIDPMANKRSNFFNPSIIGIRPNDKPAMPSQPPTDSLPNPSELVGD